VATTTGHPGRILIVLAVLVAGLITLMAVSGTWTPKLGLDLRGGTTITLTAKNTTGTGAVDPNSLQLAKTIIQSRVDSLGVGESEVTTSGDNQLIVTVPNVQQDELVRLVGQTAVLRFRAVYAAEQVQPPEPTPGATSQPSAAPSAQPSGEPGTGASESAKAPSSPEPSASKTGNNKPMPALPTAPPLPVDKACVPADGKGTPPDQALGWQPTEACQAAFAEFTCQSKVTDVPDQGLFACNQEKTEKYLLGPTLIEGNQLTKAVAGIPQNNVNWVVNLEFNADGAAAFEKATRQISQQSEPQNRFAIVLDGVSISAPSVNEAIPGGRAEISGNFTHSSAGTSASLRPSLRT